MTKGICLCRILYCDDTRPKSEQQLKEMGELYSAETGEMAAKCELSCVLATLHGRLF